MMTNDSPFVSILVPVYGVEMYIEKCAHSLFLQSYENLEYIFVDDCTKDNSIDILESIIDKYPSRKSQVRIIRHKENKGLAGARNSGVAAATGEFICHVDSDDWIETTYIEKMIEAQHWSHADLIRSNDKRVFKDHEELRANSSCTDSKNATIDVILRKARHTIWGLLIKRSLYSDNNIRTIEGCNMGEDYQVVPRLYYYANKIAYSDAVYYYNKTNDSSYTLVVKESTLRQSLQSAESIFEFFLDKDATLGACAHKALSQSYYSLLSQAIKSGYAEFAIFITNKISLLPHNAVRSVSLGYRFLTLPLPFLIKRLFLLTTTKIIN